jgi:hypothetical protein
MAMSLAAEPQAEAHCRAVKVYWFQPYRREPARTTPAIFIALGINLAV